MSRDTLHIPLDEIIVADTRRPVDDEVVKRLAASLKEIGLQHPITVRSLQGKFHLVAGRHRLEAHRRIGANAIPAIVSKFDKIDAEMWEISENLHRAELSKLERAENIERWRALKNEKGAKVSHPCGGEQPHEKGYAKTAAELGVDRKEVQDAARVSSLTDEAKVAARETGLDDNRSALLQAAREPAEHQAAKISELAAAKAAKPFKVAADPLEDTQANEKQVARLMDAWNAAGPDARQEFLCRIDQPIMDRRYA